MRSPDTCSPCPASFGQAAAAPSSYPHKVPFVTLAWVCPVESRCHLTRVSAVLAALKLALHASRRASRLSLHESLIMPNACP